MIMDTPTGLPTLAGMGVLLTQPRARAEAFARRLAARGARPYIFPGIALAEPTDARGFDACVGRLDTYDMVVFVSPSAVEAAMPAFRASRPEWPGATRIAAVGQGTAGALRAYGIDDVLAPASSSGAAALLALPALRAAPPKRVLIVRGEGGRDDLAQGLAELGSHTDHAECFRRVRPNADSTELLRAWRAGGVDVVVVTSVEILDNLTAMLGQEGAALLRSTPLVTHHARIADAARAKGIAVAVEADADGDGIIVALERQWRHHD